MNRSSSDRVSIRIAEMYLIAAEAGSYLPAELEKAKGYLLDLKAKRLKPEAMETPRTKVGAMDAEQLRKEQQLLLDYARMAVTEENVGLLAKQALAARGVVAASTLAEEYPRDFARIIGLHTYSQSPRRAYDITLTGNWVERGGFRFEEFILTPRREDADHGRTE